jgi:hypothetical protein
MQQQDAGMDSSEGRTDWKLPMKPRRRPAVIALTCAGLYVASYVINSALGGYWMKPERDLHDRYTSGLSLSTACHWQPRFGYNSRFVTDFTGHFYGPLIRLDRWLIHSTHYLTDANCDGWLDSLSISQMHPKFRDEARKARSKRPSREPSGADVHSTRENQE